MNTQPDVNSENVVPNDPIRAIKVNGDAVEVATAYWFSDGVTDYVDNPNKVALASIVENSHTDDLTLAQYLADECIKVYPKCLKDRYLAADLLEKFNIHILHTTVLRSDYAAAGFSSTGITVHNDIHKFIRNLRLNVSVDLDSEAKPVINRLNIYPVHDDFKFQKGEVDYVYINSERDIMAGKQRTHYISFYCLCNLKDVDSENYAKTVEAAINHHLYHHIIPYFNRIAAKLSQGV